MLQNILDLVINHLGNFHDLMQIGLSIIRKTVFVNLYYPIGDFIIIPVSSDPLNIEIVERKRKYGELKSQELKEVFKLRKNFIMIQMLRKFFLRTQALRVNMQDMLI